MYAIEVENVCKNLKNKKILVDINLNVKKGIIFGLVGCNGSGKSSLIKSILSLYNVDKGIIKIFNKNIKNNNFNYYNVGVVLDSKGVYKYFSGRRNLILFNLLRGANNEDNINKIISMLDMENYIDKIVNTYSLGMMQRLNLAIALLNKPKLLVLDEPINGLDPKAVIEVRNILIKLKIKYNITVLVSSHILSELENICDEVAFIEDGKVKKIISMDGNKKLEDFFIERSK